MIPRINNIFISVCEFILHSTTFSWANKKIEGGKSIQNIYQSHLDIADNKASKLICSFDVAIKTYILRGKYS